MAGAWSRNPAGRGSYQKAVDHAKNYYKNEMRSILKSDDSITEEQLEAEHQQIQNKAMNEYDDWPKIGVRNNNALNIKNWLKVNIEIEYGQLRKEWKLKTELATLTTQNCVQACAEKYYEHILCQLENLRTMDDLMKCHRNAKSAAVENVIIICSKGDPDDIERYEEEIHETIEEYFLDVHKRFQCKRRKEEKTTAALLTEARQTYHTEMDKHFIDNLFITPTQLNEFHSEVGNTIIKKCGTNTNLSRFQIEDIKEALDTHLETYENKNGKNDYRKLMEIELSNVTTLEELMEAHVNTKAATLDRLSRTCLLKDKLLRENYVWKLCVYIEKSFEEIKHNLAVTGKLCISEWGKNLSDGLLEISPNVQTMSLTKQEKQDVVQRWASETAMQLNFRIPSATMACLQNQLTPKNISNIRLVYDQALRNILSEAQKYVDPELWNELDRLVDEEYNDKCTVDLDAVTRQIQKFYLRMKNKFDVLNGLTSDDLEKFGEEEILKASRDELFPGGNLKVGMLVEIGCSRLMTNFRKQNQKIIKNRDKFAETLIEGGMNFYDKEMRRLLWEETYPPEELKKMHEGISGKLLKTLSQPIKSIDPDEEKVAALKTTLEKSFDIHLQQNNSRLKKIQEEANNIMRAAKSSYVAKIEVTMKENPDGLDEVELYKRHHKIAQDAVKLLETETQHAIVHNEPLDKHQQSFQVYVAEYWKYISEINNLNLKKGRLRESFDGKTKLAEDKMKKDHDLSRQGEGPEPKMHLDEATVKENSDREHQLESEIASPSKSRQQLLNQCHEIKEQLQGGTVYKIKSGVVKGMFAKKIEEAIAVAKNPESTLAQIQDQEEALKKWSTKYQK